MKKINIRSRIQHISSWVRQHKIMTIAIVLFFGVIFGGIAVAVLQKPEPTKAPTVAKKATPKPQVKYYSPLTGKLVTDEFATMQPVTAIMLENSPEARPQSGLKQAGVVYEAIAEGGITRFLALYQQEKPQVVGPVRSLRMYFVDWAAAYNASIAHVGGSKAALDEVRNGNYRDIDQFFNGDSYWRANDRRAPHNVYTSFERLDKLNASNEYTKSTFASFPRVDGKAVNPPTATIIAIKVSGATYNSDYSYDAATNSYRRNQGGAPHLDREEGQIQPNVVVAMKVNMNRIQEDGYRENIETVGTGQAVVFQNGTATEVTWHKPDRTSTIRLSDASGNDVPLVRGQTWITAVPNLTGSVTWQ